MPTHLQHTAILPTLAGQAVPTVSESCKANPQEAENE